LFSSDRVHERWIVDTSQQAIEVRGRESKRRIVEETLVPGASVARVARAHGVNANQVFGWRRLYRQGRLERKETNLPSLLPVRVTGAAIETVHSTATMTRRTPSGMIHLELPKGQLRIAGRVDAEALRVVLEKLLA
jgi:transposase